LPARPRYYLDVAAIRIQDWLARTPALKQWRGASVMLSDATAEDQWRANLPPGTEWNDEAGDLAGVVSLRATDELDEQAARSRLREAAAVVVAELRRKLPHCQFESFIGGGPTYAHAYQQISVARRRGEDVVNAPAAPSELMLAMLCKTCLQAPAAAGLTVTWPGGSPTDQVCPECKERFKVATAGRTTGSGPAVPRAEAWLRDALAGPGYLVSARFPDDFDQLADAAVSGAAGDAQTQVALIYADGNRVGAFLEKAANAAVKKPGKPERADIVTAISHATRAALTISVYELFHGRDPWPIMPHLADGDDLMVSVAASDAWPFVRRFLREFSTQLEQQTKDWPAEVRRHQPTVSAGVVFHHQTHPFSDVVRLAKEHLDRAKQQFRGKEAAVAFLDLTADGGIATDRLPRSLADLDAQADLLDRIAGLSNSNRAMLLGLCRHAAQAEQVEQPGQPAGLAGRREPATQTLARRMIELDTTPLLELLGTPEARPDLKQVLDAIRAEGNLPKLRMALDTARWWPEPTGAVAVVPR
jgi:hypothetical protein